LSHIACLDTANMAGKGKGNGKNDMYYQQYQENAPSQSSRSTTSTTAVPAAPAYTPTAPAYNIPTSPYAQTSPYPPAAPAGSPYSTPYPTAPSPQAAPAAQPAPPPARSTASRLRNALRIPHHDPTQPRLESWFAFRDVWDQRAPRRMLPPRVAPAAPVPSSSPPPPPMPSSSGGGYYQHPPTDLPDMSSLTLSDRPPPPSYSQHSFSPRRRRRPWQNPKPPRYRRSSRARGRVHLGVRVQGMAVPTGQTLGLQTSAPPFFFFFLCVRVCVLEEPSLPRR
jgi:hypothetical protein